MSYLHGGTGREIPLSWDLRAHLESESRALSRQPAPVRTASFLDVLALDHLGGTPHPSISSIPSRQVLPTEMAGRKLQAPTRLSKLVGGRGKVHFSSHHN